MRTPWQDGWSATILRTGGCGAVARTLDRPAPPDGGAPGRASARQGEPERAAAAVGGLHPDAAAVRLDDPPAHGEPDARPVPLAVAAREHAEDPPRLLRAHADPVVADREDPLVAVAQG